MRRQSNSRRGGSARSNGIAQYGRARHRKGVVMTSCDKKCKGEEKQLQCEEIHLRLICLQTERSDFMKGLVFDTENRIQFKDFSEPLLDSLQKEVSGYIEVVHPKYLPEGLCMVVDDEGRLKGSAINNIASVLYGTPEHGQPIVGNAVILREGFVAGERDFVSLTEDDETGLMLLLFALGISIKDESEAE